MMLVTTPVLLLPGYGNIDIKVVVMLGIMTAREIVIVVHLEVGGTTSVMKAANLIG
jgi:hypothetical protein